MKKKIISACVWGCLVWGTVAFAADSAGTDLSALPQVYQRERLITLNKQNVADGNGTLYGKFSFTRDTAVPEQAIKEIGWMTLYRGDSVGLHPHSINEDAYIIVSGEGIFTDGSGTDTVVRAGDITIARPGQKHGLRNEKAETPCIPRYHCSERYISSEPSAARKKVRNGGWRRYGRE